MTKMSWQKLKYLENKKSFSDEIKNIFHHFKRLSIKQITIFFERRESIKGCWEWILTQPGTPITDYSLSGLKWHIRLRISISHTSISGIVIHGRGYIYHYFYFYIFYFSDIFYDCSLIFICFCFDVSWQQSEQPRIHSNLFNFFLIDH